jgi:hypothetical protein
MIGAPQVEQTLSKREEKSVLGKVGLGVAAEVKTWDKKEIAESACSALGIVAETPTAPEIPPSEAKGASRDLLVLKVNAIKGITLVEAI